MTTVTRHPGVTAAGTGLALQLLTNLMNNPRASLALTNIQGSFGTGGTGTVEMVATGGPLPECPSFVRRTWATAQTATTSTVQVYNGLAGANLVTPNKPYVGKVWVRSNVAITIRPKFGWWLGSTYKGGSNGSAVLLAANTWTQLPVEAVAHAEADRAQMNTDPEGGLVAAGTVLDVTGWLLYEKPAGSPSTVVYGDGDLPDWTWSGPAHNSPSSGYGAIA